MRRAERNGHGNGGARLRGVVACLAVLLGCAFIWLATPYNNFLLYNSFISDTYFPEVAVIFLLALILVANPLLRLISRNLVLTTRQLSLVFALILVAAILPSQGLLRMLPYSLARTTQDANANKQLADVHEKMRLPASLFVDKLGYGKETPVSDQFLDRLRPGQTVPWRQWLPALLTWGPLLLACWLLTVGLAMILYPHWRENERLPFPLLTVQQHLIEDIDANHLLPPLFRDRLFWAGCGFVMALYALNGLNHHTHGAVPGFPLGWRLGDAFTESPWRYISPWIRNVPHIQFVLVGMAFFMPTRIGFSMWFTMIAYAVYEMITTAYFPPFPASAMRDHRNGATLAVVGAVVLLARRQWAAVARAMVRRPATAEAARNRAAGWMFAAGGLGMFAWLAAMGVHAGWAAVFVAIAVAVSLVVARIVAETGMPFVRIDALSPQYLMGLVPAAWITRVSLYLAGFVDMLFSFASRVNTTAMATHAVGLQENATPRQQIRLCYLMIGVLAAGLVVCGAVHLNMSYHHASSLDGKDTPLSAWGSQRMEEVQNLLLAWTRGSWGNPSYRQGAHVAAGFGIAAALQWACLATPRWPLHPIGLLIVGTVYGNVGWACILIGWVAKWLLVRYGGSGLYRRARPFFFGVILGEVFSAIVWTLVPVILILLGNDPAEVGHIEVLQQ